MQRLLLTARLFETLYLRTCLYTQIYILMECSMKTSTRKFYISSPGWFSLRWRRVAPERRLIHVSGKIGLWNADRRIDNLSFESFLMRGITDICCEFLNDKNYPRELTWLKFHHSKWYKPSGLIPFLGPVYLAWYISYHPILNFW